MADSPSPRSDGASRGERSVDRKRRGVLRAMFGSFMGVGFTSLGAAGGLWTLGSARFLFPNVLAEPPTRFKVGMPEAYPPEYVETRFQQSHGIWVVHVEYRGKRQICALRTVCTHLGCITLWQASEQRFKCPCHGSGFYPNGINFEGPAPRPLERYAIRLAEDGQLEVDRSRVFRQELSQWDDPDSYVAVS
jgi:cytochrome b6-f complex iron-sulfur subunit